MLLNPDLFSPDVKTAATRDGFGQALVELAASQKRVVALTADLSESVRMAEFAKTYPDRFFEMGVAEQNMIGVAAGLAANGLIPFAASYATFSPGRSLDQIRTSVAISNLNVKIIGAHAGLSVGPDGATHQALEDIALMRTLPNMIVVSPADSLEAAKATLAIGKYVGPSYLRLHREASPLITTESTPFTLGKMSVLKDGEELAILATGPILFQALLAAKILAQRKIKATVVNVSTIKPLDTVTLARLARNLPAMVVVEEHQSAGGLFSAIAEWSVANHPMPIASVGVADRFGQSGKVDELYEEYGLKAGQICLVAEKLLKSLKVAR